MQYFCPELTVENPDSPTLTTLAVDVADAIILNGARYPRLGEGTLALTTDQGSSLEHMIAAWLNDVFQNYSIFAVFGTVTLSEQDELFSITSYSLLFVIKGEYDGHSGKYLILREY